MENGHRILLSLRRFVFVCSLFTVLFLSHCFFFMVFVRFVVMVNSSFPVLCLYFGQHPTCLFSCFYHHDLFSMTCVILSKLYVLSIPFFVIFTTVGFFINNRNFCSLFKRNFSLYTFTLLTSVVFDYSINNFILNPLYKLSYHVDLS